LAQNLAQNTLRVVTAALGVVGVAALARVGDPTPASAAAPPALGACFTATGAFPPGPSPASGGGAPADLFVKLGFAPVAVTAKTTGHPAIDAILRRHGGAALQPIAPLLPTRRAGGVDLRGVFRVHLADGADARAVAHELEASGEVVYAEPRRLFQLAVTPNDPSFANQAAYLNAMAFPTAWNTTTGAQGSSVIAICDGGTAWRHADLLANVWTNPGEIANNGVDDDGNGWIDDVHGWNFTNGTNDPTGLPSTPQSADHGTHVAGIACATAGNAAGIAGASFNARFLPICAASPTTDDAIAYGYEGILYAVANGADVVNCSWSAPGNPSAFEQDVIDYAYEHGTLVVCAAGNGGSELAQYPAAYTHTLAVANVTTADAANATSSFGTWIDVAAQGTNILSTVASIPNGYGLQTGTSMASPHVAALCALVKNRFPGYTAEQVMQRVRVTADDIEAGLPANRKGKMGFGRIDAVRALLGRATALGVTSVATATSDGDARIEPGETVTLTLGVTNWLAACGNVTLALRTTSPYAVVRDSMATLAGLDSMQTVTLPPLRLDIAASTPPHTLVPLTLAVTTTAPAYHDRCRFEILVAPVFATHHANRIACSVTSVGKLGYAVAAGGNGKDGSGFRFDGSGSLLFEAGLLIGTGPATVSDACRTNGTLQDDDFATAPNGTPWIETGRSPWTEQASAAFTDALAASPLGLHVLQQSFESAAAPGDACLVLRYRIRNDSGAARHGVRVGWFCDWDIDGIHYDTNATNYDAGRGLLYASDTSSGGPNAVIGLLTLTAPGTTAARGIWNDPRKLPTGACTTATRMPRSGRRSPHPVRRMSLPARPTSPSASELDPSTSHPATPSSSRSRSSPATRSRRCAPRPMPRASCGRASRPTPCGSKPVRCACISHRTFRIHSIPTPSSRTHFPSRRGSICASTGVDGRVVRWLVRDFQTAGVHRVLWDGRDDRGRLLPSGIYFVRLDGAGESRVRKLQLVK
jgi:hypothetical protein